LLLMHHSRFYERESDNKIHVQKKNHQSEDQVITERLQCEEESIRASGFDNLKCQRAENISVDLEYVEAVGNVGGTLVACKLERILSLRI